MPAFAVPAAWRAYGAGYLDKSEVTDRVMTVVKNFNKVEPSKVRQKNKRKGEGSGESVPPLLLHTPP